MKKRVIIYLTLLLSLFFIGCGKVHSDNTNPLKRTNTEELDAKKKDIQKKGHITVKRSEGPGKEFLSLPMYFQQDYKDIPFGNSTIGSCGNLLVCLSMMESKICNDYINPVDFMKKYELYLSDKGINKSVLQKMASNDNRDLRIETFDLKALGEYLRVNRLPVLIRINKPSKYCETSTYIIAIGFDETGLIKIRDPNQANISKFAKITEDGETWYDPTSICQAIGNDSLMYIFF